MIDPAQLIDRARFNDHYLDNGTGGLCGTFALALYRATVNLSPAFVLIGMERDGKPLMAREGGYVWRHAAIKIGNRYFDIDGEQKLEWMFSNYLWETMPQGASRAVHVLSTPEFLAEMKTTKSAWDKPFYDRCVEMLTKAHNAIFKNSY